MKVSATAMMVRMLPVVLLAAAAMLYAASIESGGAYVARNMLPMLVVVILAAVTLYKGGGSWVGSGWSWLLGTIGYTVPAIGLSLYLHYGYANDLNGMYSNSIFPDELFRFLPVYTAFAGGIGFAIGWIAGRNV